MQQLNDFLVRVWVEHVVGTWDNLLAGLSARADFITSMADFVTALGCIYLSAVILKERAALVHVQRVSLAFLAVAMFANAIYDFPEWQLIDGHRPTAVAVNIMFAINILVMCLRGNIIVQPFTRSRGDHSGGGAATASG